jgi:hypothetical protein
VGVAVPLPVPQATPLRVKAVGEAFVPLYVALKPKFAEPPVARAAFQDRLLAETAVPLWVRSVLQ